MPRRHGVCRWPGVPRIESDGSSTGAPGSRTTDLLLIDGHNRRDGQAAFGLFCWIGFDRVSIPYQREPRLAGRSKFGFWKLWNFALEGITSFSTAPLRIATYLGIATALVAFVYGAWIIAKALLWGDPVAGWPTMMAVILFLGGVQLVALGLIGEYLGRLYEEAKQRPLYLVDAWVPATGVSSGSSTAAGGQHAQRPPIARVEIG